MRFEAPGIEKQLFIFISKGEVSTTHVGNGPSFGKIILEDIKFDSSDLVKIAKEKYDLQKGWIGLQDTILQLRLDQLMSSFSNEIISPIRQPVENINSNIAFSISV
ncbi:hypothetical protein ABEX60_11105 [Viridibacillus arvi]